MIRSLFLICVILGISYAQDGYATGALMTSTCANVTVLPVPQASDFPGYNTSCILGYQGCSRMFNDPAESLLPYPSNQNPPGEADTDIITSFVTWNEHDLFFMLETIAFSLNATGAMIPSSTECLILSDFRVISVCIDVESIDTTPCDTEYTYTPKCSDGAPQYDFAFWLQSSYAVNAPPLYYDLINIYSQSKISANGTCIPEPSGPANPVNSSTGIEFWTPNGDDPTSPYCDNPAGYLPPNDPLRRQTFFKIPLSLIGNPKDGDMIKIYAYMDNAAPPGDDLAPANPYANYTAGDSAVGAVFHLSCSAPTNSPPPNNCGNGICEAGLENCYNCPQDCYGTIDPYNPYGGTVAPKSKYSSGNRTNSSKSKILSPSQNTTTSAPKRKSVGKNQDLLKAKLGKGKEPGKTGGKNKNWGKGKLNQVCCGYFNGTGDGCSAPECITAFIPTTVPPPAGKGKNQGSAKGKNQTSTKSVQSGKSKVVSGHQRRQLAKNKNGAPLIGNYECINVASYCGDGICFPRGGENCTSCPQDCGGYASWNTGKEKAKAVDGGPLKRRTPGKGKGKVAQQTCCGGDGTCNGCAPTLECAP